MKNLRWQDEIAFVADALRAADLPVAECGLNADWSARAWCLTPGADPNRSDGATYMIHDEDGDPADPHYRYSLVRFWPSRLDDDEDRAYEWTPDTFTRDEAIAEYKRRVAAGLA